MTRSIEKLEERLRVETITPQRALTMLLTGVLPDEEVAKLRASRMSLDALTKLLDRKTSDRRNRKISIPRVQRMARDMTNDNWHFTGDPVKIEDGGFALDGQHRLLAIFVSGVKQDVAVLYGADEKVQLVTDTGRPRSAMDQLTIRGTKHARHVSSAASLLLRWRANQIMNSQFQPTVSEVTQFVEGTPELLQGATSALRILHHIRHAPMSAIIAAYVQSGTIVDHARRDYFFERLERGDELEAHDPILTLRNTFSRYSPDRPVPFRLAGRLWQVVHAWNKWQGGEKIMMLRVPSTLTSDNFPRMR